MRVIRLLAAGAALAFTLQLAPVARAGEGFVGRRIAEVLRELRGEGLDFVFSSDLIPEDLRVVSEPSARTPLEIARELLAAHDLGLTELRPGLYAVVRALSTGAHGRISGRIFDARTGQPIARARITIDAGADSTLSDESGSFAFEDLPGGAHVLGVAAADHVSRRLDVVTAGATRLEIRLEATPLEEIVVSTSRYAAEESGATASFLLEGTRLAEQPGLADDPVRVLARLPGIAQSGASAQSNVRGGETREVLILLDGFRLRQAFHLPGYQSFFSVLDSGLIREAEIFTGGFPARYGNRLSGVFDLRTLNAAREPRRSLGLSFFNATARVSDVLERPASADWLAALRVGTLRPLLEAFAPDVGLPSYADAYARGSFGAGAWRSSVNFLWARDELSVDVPRRGERAELESRSRYLWLRSDWNEGQPLSAFITVGNSRIDALREGTVAAPAAGVGSVDDLRLASFWDLRAVGTWQPGHDHRFEAGFEWTDESADYRYVSSVRYTPAIAALFARGAELTRDFTLAPSRNRSASFASHRWRITPAITSEIGLRAQHLETTGADSEWTYDPRVSLRWQIGEATSLRAHWGRFHQADEIQELQIEDGLTLFPAAQRSDHLILGLEHRLSDDTSLRIEGFRKYQTSPRARFENTLDALALLPELAPDRTRIAPDRAELLGVEVSALRERAAWTQWIAVTWSQAFDQFGPADVPRTWDQRWALNAGVDWTRGPWRVGAALNLHTGWATTALLVAPDGTVMLGPRNQERLPFFGALDLRGEYRRALEHGELSLALEITNATNRRNLCCTQLTLDPADPGLLTTSPRRWLPLVPSLSVRWDF